MDPDNPTFDEVAPPRAASCDPHPADDSIRAGPNTEPYRPAPTAMPASLHRQVIAPNKKAATNKGSAKKSRASINDAYALFDRDDIDKTRVSIYDTGLVFGTSALTGQAKVMLRKNNFRDRSVNREAIESREESDEETELVAQDRSNGKEPADGEEEDGDAFCRQTPTLGEYLSENSLVAAPQADAGSNSAAQDTEIWLLTDEKLIERAKELTELFQSLLFDASLTIGEPDGICYEQFLALSDVGGRWQLCHVALLQRIEVHPEETQILDIIHTMTSQLDFYADLLLASSRTADSE